MPLKERSKDPFIIYEKRKLIYWSVVILMKLFITEPGEMEKKEWMHLENFIRLRSFFQTKPQSNILPRPKRPFLEAIVATILFWVLLSQSSGRSLNVMERLKKMKMTHDGFYGDIFSDGFGGFQTMKKRGYQVSFFDQFLIH